jgi:hypothetical protein
VGHVTAKIPWGMQIHVSPCPPYPMVGFGGTIRRKEICMKMILMGILCEFWAVCHQAAHLFSHFLTPLPPKNVQSICLESLHRCQSSPGSSTEYSNYEYQRTSRIALNRLACHDSDSNGGCLGLKIELVFGEVIFSQVFL